MIERYPKDVVGLHYDEAAALLEACDVDTSTYGKRPKRVIMQRSLANPLVVVQAVAHVLECDGRTGIRAWYTQALDE